MFFWQKSFCEKKRKFSNGESDEKNDEEVRRKETGRQKGDESNEGKEVIVTCTALHFLL